jgi:hypothetical protein
LSYKLMIPFQTPEDFIPKFPDILPRRNSTAILPQVERDLRARLSKRAGTARSTREKRKWGQSYKLMIPFQTPEDFIPKIPNVLFRRNSTARLPQVERAVPARLSKRAGTARSTREKRARRSRSTSPNGLNPCPSV